MSIVKIFMWKGEIKRNWVCSYYGIALQPEPLPLISIQSLSDSTLGRKVTQVLSCTLSIPCNKPIWRCWYKTTKQRNHKRGPHHTSRVILATLTGIILLIQVYIKLTRLLANLGSKKCSTWWSRVSPWWGWVPHPCEPGYHLGEPGFTLVLACANTEIP